MCKKYSLMFCLLFSLTNASAATNYCHGALGMQCGNPANFQLGLCIKFLGSDFAICGINAGSWKHDECCVAQPNSKPGMMCNGGGESSKICQPEWNLARSRLDGGYNWSRLIDTRINDSTPRTIDRDKFCAKGNSKIHAADDDNLLCCSHQSRGPNILEAFFDPQARRCR
jgi:hypothetical protein